MLPGPYAEEKALLEGFPREGGVRLLPGGARASGGGARLAMDGRGRCGGGSRGCQPPQGTSTSVPSCSCSELPPGYPKVSCGWRALGMERVGLGPGNISKGHGAELVCAAKPLQVANTKLRAARLRSHSWRVIVYQACRWRRTQITPANGHQDSELKQCDVSYVI